MFLGRESTTLASLLTALNSLAGASGLNTSGLKTNIGTRNQWSFPNGPLIQRDACHLGSAVKVHWEVLVKHSIKKAMEMETI